MKSVLIFIFLLVGNFSYAVGPDGVDYDFSPFPLKEGRVLELAGKWGNDVSMVTLEHIDREYWGMPIFTYLEVNSDSGDLREGIAWVSHSKEHYWLLLRLNDGTTEIKKLYFGYIKGVNKFSKKCGNVAQAPAIMVLDSGELLERAKSMTFHIDEKSEACSF